MAPNHDMINFQMATFATAGAIRVSEGLLRCEAVSNALTDLRLEGLKPSGHVLHLLSLYSSGEISEAELIDRVIAR